LSEALGSVLNSVAGRVYGFLTLIVPFSPGKEKSVANVTEVSDGSFDQEVLKAQVPVLIDFWAPWCGPCKAISPVVEQLAGEYGDRIKVVKMNVDDNPQTPSRYGVRGIPNLILFKGGEVADQIVGAVPRAHLVKAIDRVLQ
jgi:thioredoxin 1